MSRLHLCVNCGDPAPDSWLCPTCESIKQTTKRKCQDRGEIWGHQVTGAVYNALTEYRENKVKYKDVAGPQTRVASTAT